MEMLTLVQRGHTLLSCHYHQEIFAATSADQHLPVFDLNLTPAPTCSRVLDQLVRVEDIIPDLLPPFCLHQVSSDLSHLGNRAATFQAAVGAVTQHTVERIHAAAKATRDPEK
jgi:hypothetical protein